MEWVLVAYHLACETQNIHSVTARKRLLTSILDQRELGKNACCFNRLNFVLCCVAVSLSGELQKCLRVCQQEGSLRLVCLEICFYYMFFMFVSKTFSDEP